MYIKIYVVYNRINSIQFDYFIEGNSGHQEEYRWWCGGCYVTFEL